MSDVARLRALVAFLPVLEASDFSAGEMKGLKPQADGIFAMPHVTRSPTADSFVKMLYDCDWISSSFSWSEWAQTEEAARLRDDAGALAAADIDQLSRLLTACVRSDRFSEGALLTIFESGLMLRITRRGGVLLQELEAKLRAKFLGAFKLHGCIRVSKEHAVSDISTPLPLGASLYMLQQNSEVLYIGSAKNDVRGRIASYVNHQRSIAREKSGAATIKKRRAMHDLFSAYLERGSVDVWVMPLDAEPVAEFDGLPVHVRLGLEHGLICTFKPPLNAETLKREC